MITKIFVCLFFLCLLLIAGCNNSKHEAVILPVFKSNKECISNYLTKANLLDSSNHMDLTPNVIDIGFPADMLGYIKIKNDGSRDMKAIYKGLEINCYSSAKRTVYLNDSTGWKQIGDDVSNISAGLDSKISNHKKIYMEIDFISNTYEIYQ